MAFEVDPRTALNKLAFGPGTTERRDITRTDIESWLVQQLQPPAEDDCAARVAGTHLRLKYISKAPEAEVDEERRVSGLRRPLHHPPQNHHKKKPGPQRSLPPP